MKILFTGRGTSGSWAVRGEQLGAACGAVVKRQATRADCQAADLVVVVKRASEETLAGIRESGRPWVFDAVDFYPQPACSAWDRGEAIAWVRQKLKALQPSAMIWPNERMREDCDTGLPGMVLKHHHRPGIARNPIRKDVRVVGYEGAAAYIEKWLPAIHRECERRGWRFTSRPAHLADLDIVLALRSGQWDCYATSHWKSGVKLANAHGSGTPFVGQQECGYIETSTGAEYWAHDAAALAVSFDWLTYQGARELVADRFLQRAYSVNDAARDLRLFLDGL